MLNKVIQDLTLLYCDVYYLHKIILYVLKLSDNDGLK